jgi:glycosyltransferase involved in cell wall biosynthesis
MSCPPKISVLIPVFNGEKYLAECLDSVLAQDFTDVEILIADDDSTDGSVAIIQTYAAREPRIRWWKNPRNCGLTGNSNVCLQAARGEYIKFVHQDDKLLSPAAIRKMSEALDATPAAAIAGCRQHLTGTGSRPRIFAEHAGYFAGRELVVTSAAARPLAALMNASPVFWISKCGVICWSKAAMSISMKCWPPGACTPIIKPPAPAPSSTGNICSSWKFIMPSRG